MNDRSVVGWKKIGWVILFLLLLAETAFALEGTGRTQTPQDLGDVRGNVLAEMAVNAVPGLAAAAVKDGHILFVEGYDGAGADRISPRTPFRLASLSKAFTAVAVLQLVEQRRIELDAPVRTYLQSFVTSDTVRSGQITVRQLLNQTSGLADAGFPEMRLAQPQTLAERVETLKDATPVAPPGREFHYFNPNYAILARVVEVVSGQDYDAYLTRHVLVPLGMTRTFAAATGSEMERRAPDLAQGHIEVFGLATNVRAALRKRPPVGHEGVRHEPHSERGGAIRGRRWEKYRLGRNSRLRGLLGPQWAFLLAGRSLFQIEIQDR